jgi:hypothetical protein
MLVLEAQNCFQIAGGPKNSLAPYQKKKKRLNPQTYNEKTFVVQLFEFHKTHNSKKMRINMFIYLFIYYGTLPHGYHEKKGKSNVDILKMEMPIYRKVKSLPL